MSDLREITITRETTFIIDADRLFTEYDAEWQDAKADGSSREDFIRESIEELDDDDLEDLAVAHPRGGHIKDEFTSDWDIRKFK